MDIKQIKINKADCEIKDANTISFNIELTNLSGVNIIKSGFDLAKYTLIGADVDGAFGAVKLANKFYGILKSGKSK